MDNLDSLAAFIGKIMIFMIIWVIILLITNWKIFKKAGKPGWHSIVPFLSAYDLFEFTWSGTMGYVAIVLSLATSFFSRAAAANEDSAILAGLSSILGIVLGVIEVIVYYKLSKSFGHGVGFFLGLLFLNPIFMMILAFGSSQYVGPNGVGYPMDGYGVPGGYSSQPGYGAPNPNASYDIYGQTNGGFNTQGYGTTPQQQGYPQDKQSYAQPQQNPFENNNNNNYGNYQ